MFGEGFRQTLALIGYGESNLDDDRPELARSDAPLDVIENRQQRKSRRERAGHVLEKRQQLFAIDASVGDFLGTATCLGFDEKHALAAKLLLDDDLARGVDPAFFDGTAAGQRLVPIIRHGLFASQAVTRRISSSVVMPARTFRMPSCSSVGLPESRWI